MDEVRSLSLTGIQSRWSVGSRLERHQRFLITAEEMTQEQQDLVEAEPTCFGVAEGSVGVEEVGGSFSKETTNRAFIAIGIAVVAIIAYLTLRFEIKFASGIAALVHDVGLTLGIYAAGRRLVAAASGGHPHHLGVFSPRHDRRLRPDARERQLHEEGDICRNGEPLHSQTMVGLSTPPYVSCCLC